MPVTRWPASSSKTECTHSDRGHRRMADTTLREHRRSAHGPLLMKQYLVVGFDVKDERLFDVAVEAPNQAVAWVMAFAQMCRNFATAPLADRADKLIVCLREK